MKKLMSVFMLVLFVAALAEQSQAVWRYRIQSVTWDTTTVDGYRQAGAGVVIAVKTWNAATTPADTFAFNMGLPLSFTVDTMRARIETACLSISHAVKRADSLKATYEGKSANVPGTN